MWDLIQEVLNELATAYQGIDSNPELRKEFWKDVILIAVGAIPGVLLATIGWIGTLFSLIMQLLGRLIEVFANWWKQRAESRKAAQKELKDRIKQEKERKELEFLYQEFLTNEMPIPQKGLIRLLENAYYGNLIESNPSTSLELKNAIIKAKKQIEANRIEVFVNAVRGMNDD